MAEQSIWSRGNHAVVVEVDNREAFRGFPTQDVLLDKLSEVGLNTKISGQSLLIS